MTPHQTAAREWSVWLNGRFPQRRDAVNVILLSFLCRVNGFILGPPGTAKSLLVSTASQIVDGFRVFDYQFHPTSKPEHIFGPLDISALKEKPSRFIHVIDGYSPTCHVFVGDEIWRGGPAIYDPLLRVINERKFNQGNQLIDLPIISFLGCSNSVPEEDSHQVALWDRMILRCKVDYLKDSGEWRRMLGWDTTPVPPAPSKIPLDELAVIHQEIRDMPITDQAKEALTNVRYKLGNEQIIISDRTWAWVTAEHDIFGNKVMSAIKAAAWLHGKTQVEVDDLADAVYPSFWNWEKDIPAAHKAIAEAVSPLDQVAQRILNEATEIKKGIAAIDPNSDAAESQLLRVHKQLVEKRNEVLGYLQNQDRTEPRLHRMADVERQIQEMMREIKAKIGLDL